MTASVLTLAVLAVLGCGAVALYLLPVLIGWARHAPDLAAVAVINVALGWTLIGWVVALAMALRTPPPPHPAVQVIMPPPGPGPGWQGPGGPLPRRADQAPPLALPPHEPPSGGPGGESPPA